MVHFKIKIIFSGKNNTMRKSHIAKSRIIIINRQKSQIILVSVIFNEYLLGRSYEREGNLVNW